jgi:signal transduction histidine kinase
MRWVHKNGKVYWSEDLFIPVRDRKGDIVEIIGIARDITERVEAEAALREANRKLNLLSSVIRHDIMNRITGIYVWIDMSRKSQDPAKIREYVDKIDEAGAAIKQILDFSAKYSGLGMKGREWVDLQEIASRNHFGMPMSGIGLNVELEGLRVLADPMLGMVFRNLIENSVRHGGNVTRIWVHWHKEDKGARIVIEDDGTGVPVEDKSRIFERGIGRGTGYGLFFAREILSISGMKITETGETGKGARFEIAVPEGGFRTEK